MIKKGQTHIKLIEKSLIDCNALLISSFDKVTREQKQVINIISLEIKIEISLIILSIENLFLRLAPIINNINSIKINKKKIIKTFKKMLYLRIY